MPEPRPAFVYFVFVASTVDPDDAAIVFWTYDKATAHAHADGLRGSAERVEIRRVGECNPVGLWTLFREGAVR